MFGYFAVLLTYEQIQAWRLAGKSRTWPSTTAVILTSEIIDEGIRHPREQPSITYAYQVNGTQYQGNRINFSFADIYDKEEATNALAPYPRDASVTVYYDPDEPSLSTLEQRHTGLGSGLFVGLVVFLPTCLCLATGMVILTGKVGR